MIFFSSYKSWLFLLVLAAISIGFSWFYHETLQNPLAHLKIDSESFGKNITIRKFDGKGQLINYLFSPQVFTDSVQKKVLFYQPLLKIFNDQQEPWIIESNQAWVTANSSVFLSGKVILNQAIGKKNNGVQIKTEALVIDLKSQIASTDKPVEFIQQGLDHSQTVIHAKGVLVNQKTGNIQLKSQTQIRYVPGTR